LGEPRPRVGASGGRQLGGLTESLAGDGEFTSPLRHRSNVQDQGQKCPQPNS